MGKNTNEILKIKNAELVAEFKEYRETVDPGRLGLAMQAVKQRVEQDLMIAIAAYEIDCALENKNFRLQRNPEDGVPEIMMIKARLDKVNELLAKYQQEYVELHPELFEENKEEEADDTIVVEESAEDGKDAGWDDTPAESDPANADE